MKINGLMVDCSRLMERHDYYFRLVDFMSDWGMNTLLFHFTDDWGCGVSLPGFPELAMPNAFSASEVRRLVKHAKARGVDVIPELEVFGHTRYLTETPRYSHLDAGKRTRDLRFNAVDPFHPDTGRLMRRLIRATTRLFPSKYLHLGCDEVDMKAYCRARGLDEAGSWADHVNRMIGIARECGREPMIWADHPSHDARIAQLLRKDVVLVDWRYEETIQDTVLPLLRRAGFHSLVCAPSIACYRHRFLPNSIALENTRRMARFADKRGAAGVINTAWCPWRYVQGALYHGVAWGARQAATGGRLKPAEFRREFAGKVFGVTCDRTVDLFLRRWPEAGITIEIAPKLMDRSARFTREELGRLERARDASEAALSASLRIAPSRNADILAAMQLAARAVWVCAENAILRSVRAPAPFRVKEYRTALREVRRELSADWDRTRFADDPQKYRSRFPGFASHHALILVRRLAAF